jgi:dihydroxyacetone kinase
MWVWGGRRRVNLGEEVWLVICLVSSETEERSRDDPVADKSIVLKLCGAAAEADYDFDTCFAIGESVNGHCVTIGSSLDYCHIPGRTHHESLPEKILSVAQGIHNEAVSWLNLDTGHN